MSFYQGSEPDFFVEDPIYNDKIIGTEQIGSCQEGGMVGGRGVGGYDHKGVSPGRSLW